ncbi:hypothetical protein O3G_MSEX008795 [Manduca sexta]|uniref:Gem-associated protein 8 n=1 Tax=Manduca sexta TaxID=7130 RepID=A0A921ZCX9_MANSE|nr:hypothetical protein O3G_MSEX008795 [Manduca sexta]
MFFQPPDQYSHSSKTLQNTSHRKRKRKSAKKKQHLKKSLHRYKHNHFSITMSSYAETFTAAATWQLKHQIAYWKSKAVALEYENKLLHDVIKKNCMKTWSDDNQTVESSQSSVKSESESEDDENDEFEVSEEFIQFLKANSMYKEDAKRERERLKAQTLVEEKSMEFEDIPETVNSFEKWKELYGKDWRRIAALEMSMKCSFIQENDKQNSMYWPNIPFNFSCV